MIKSKDELKRRPIEIDLTGPDGNVFYLMATAKRLSRQLYDFVTEELENARAVDESLKLLYDGDFKTPENMGDWIVEEMMKSDYEHAVQVFDKYFGAVVTLYR